MAFSKLCSFTCLVLIFLVACSSTSSRFPKYEKLTRSYDVSKSISPCVDFYQYTCSEVGKKFTLPSDRPYYFFSFSDANESIQRYKKEYLKYLVRKKPRTDIEKTLRNFYLSCINTKAIKKDEISYIQELKRELSRIKTKSAMLDYLVKQIVSGRSGLLTAHTIQNFDDPSFVDFYLFTFLPRLTNIDDYRNPEVREDFILLNEKLFRDLGFKNSLEIATFIFEFEWQLAEHTPSPESIRKRLTQREMNSKAELLKLTHLRPNEVLKEIPHDTVIRNVSHSSLEWMNAEVAKLSLAQLKYLFIYLNLRDVIDESSPSYFKMRFDFAAKYLGGSPVRRELYERCTIQTIKSFPMELDYILLPKIFPTLDRVEVVALAEKMRSTIIDSLASNTWLSPKGKRAGMAKMKKAQLQIMAPETETDWNFRPRAQYSPTKMVHNLIKLREIIKRKELSDIGVKISKNVWVSGPLDVNAYYEPAFNQFTLPAAILQKPFFDQNRPMEENLAAIGTIVGHELGHGIDDNGSQYDGEGRLKDWFTEADHREFSRRTEPLIKIFEDTGHNGKLTLGENIGDMVGLTMSFKAAFPNYVPGKYPRKKLQNFFLLYARLWCEVQTPGFKRSRLSYDPHSLGFARANEQVKHASAFQEAFSCKSTDPMVIPASQRLKIW